MQRLLRGIATTITAVTAMLMFAPAPARAEQVVVAAIAPGVNCPSNQIMVGGTFVLSRVPSGRSITVNTEVGNITEKADTHANTTSTYVVAFAGRLNLSSPATTTIVTDNWDGSFRMTAASCQTPSAPGVRVVSTPCNVPARLTVDITNPNPIMVTYEAGGPQLPTRSQQIRSNLTNSIAFEPIERGRIYQINVNGNDGTRVAMSISVPGCAPAPPAPPPQPSVAATLVPSTPTPAPTPTPTVSPTTSPTPSASPTVSPSPTAPSPLPLNTPVVLAQGVPELYNPPNTVKAMPIAQQVNVAGVLLQWLLAGVLLYCGGMLLRRSLRRQSEGH